jgi:hypothetical protein
MTASKSPGVSRGYRIRVAGRLDGSWAAWFDGFTVAAENDGTTTLSGSVVDQAQLHGLFAKLRDLGLDVVSLEAINPVEGIVTPRMGDLSGRSRASDGGTGSPR